MTKWISRASVMRIIDADPVYSDVINEKTYMASQISNLPTKEEPDRPHGEWEKESLQIDEHHFRSYAKCKVCGCSFKPYSFAVKEFDFCPKCGADLRKKEGERNE